jgi:hypothetical protein
MASTVQPAVGGFYQGEGEPATHLFLITASDTNYLPYVTRAIRVGGAGNLRVLTAGNEDVIIPSVLAGETIPVCVVKVFSTSTTATSLMGMW